MSRGMKSRLQAAAKRVPTGEAENPWAACIAAIWDRRELFLDRCPADLREAIAEKYFAGDISIETDIDGLADMPFAKWAPPVPPDYQFPRPLCEFIADTPYRFSFLHYCDACGLAFPIYFIGGGEPALRGRVGPFTACPACGGEPNCYIPPADGGGSP